MKKLVSAGELADDLGISPGRVRQLTTAGALPREARNSYHLIACRRAYQDFKKAAAGGDESEYLNYLKKKNDQLELENKVRKGDLIHRDDFLQASMSTIAACRARLLALPSKAAPLLVATDDRRAKKIIDRLIDEALRELRVPDFRRIAKDRQKEKRRS